MVEYKVGDIVECINDQGFPSLLRKGNRYIVSNPQGREGFFIRIQTQSYYFKCYRFKLVTPSKKTKEPKLIW